MIRHLLLTSNLVISCGLWLPSQIKMARTKSAKDYQPLTFALILWLQAASFIVARLDGSGALQLYFAVNGTNVLLTLLLILKYR